MSNCDIKISRATVVDGSGGAPFVADVAIEAGRIVDIGDLGHCRAEELIDAAGLVLAPGFIDVHTHDDLALLETPDVPFKLSQGVTSVVAGNCGISIAPFATGNGFPDPFPLLGHEDRFRFPRVADYRAKLDRNPPAVNVALLAGHSSLRVEAMGTALDRVAPKDAVTRMATTLRTALQDGCIGMSTGLDYPPARHASTDEIISLAGVLTGFDGAVYATHMRDEGDHVVEAIQETLRIGARAGVCAVISHHKCAGRRNYGRSVETLALIEQAQKTQAVGLDVYPYTASSTTLLPRFIRDAESVLVAYSQPYPECEGRMLHEIAGEWGCTLEAAAERLYPAAAIYFQIDEDDLRRIMAFPSTMIGSDGLPGMDKPHPRLWGTFPRVLGRYVRELKLLSLPGAIRKMTGLSAQTFGLRERGLVRIGYHADLVLFDADAVQDVGDFAAPAQVSRGIERVFVDGHSAWIAGAPTGVRRGRFLTH